jgi:hypothetical protein
MNIPKRLQQASILCSVFWVYSLISMVWFLDTVPYDVLALTFAILTVICIALFVSSMIAQMLKKEFSFLTLVNIVQAVPICWFGWFVVEIALAAIKQR